MLLDNLQEDLKKAQLERKEIKVSTLRLLLSEIHNAQILLRQSFHSDDVSSERAGQEKEISDEDIIQVIQREVKKRKEAAAGFRTGGRELQAQKEEEELAVLQSYLPEELSSEELTQIVSGVINELGAKGLADMGGVMAAVMRKVAGRADGGKVSMLVREKLS